MVYPSTFTKTKQVLPEPTGIVAHGGEALVDPATQSSIGTPQPEAAPTGLVAHGQANQPIQPGSNYMTPETTSADRLTDMIDENNPYIQSAVNYANQASSGTGRLNSSYAAQAGTRAAIDAAAPFAQQDAQTAAQFNLQEQTAESQLVRDNVQNEYDITAAKNLADSNMARETLVQDATMERLNVTNQNAIDSALLNADAQTTQGFNTTYGQMSQQLTQGLATIDSSNMDDDAKVQAKNDLIATFNHDVAGLVNITNAGLGNYQISWEPQTSLDAGGTSTSDSGGAPTSDSGSQGVSGWWQDRFTK